MGGLAARAHGAERQTSDVDCVPNTTVENLERMAAALVELDGRLRVGGMSDEEARSLPVTIDAETLSSFGSSTWMTDAFRGSWVRAPPAPPTSRWVILSADRGLGEK